ncbi:hypothetical protein A2U01_0007920 [Trifolium medium]|uniref:Uncharacterized protein n=1 Tax=Trifolium medium TaxID=97028 RepID=A0A392MIZ5_9FABA|nr:hypothetical protein [Trifolium medium]
MTSSGFSLLPIAVAEDRTVVLDPYQVQRQSPLDQLTISSLYVYFKHALVYLDELYLDYEEDGSGDCFPKTQGSRRPKSLVNGETITITVSVPAHLVRMLRTLLCSDLDDIWASHFVVSKQVDSN